MPRPKARRGARARSWRARLRERLREIVPERAWLDPWLCALAVTLLLIALEPYVWLAKLLAELQLQLALGACLGAAWALWRKRWLRAAGLLAGALIWGSPSFPYLRAARPTPQHGPVLEIVQQHLADAALDSAGLQRFLREHHPDVLSLTGIRSSDVAALAAGAPGYRRLPHGEHALLWAQSALSVQPSAKPAAQLRVGACTLGLTQLVLPSLFSARAQPARLAAVGGLARTELAPRHVLLGYFGARAEAADLRGPLRALALRDARLGHGVLATAPALLGPLGLPVDQLLVRGWILVREARALAPLVPAAHRGLSFTLELTEPRCAKGPRPR